MRKKERYEKILAWFRENVPVAETELHYDNPFELLPNMYTQGITLECILILTDYLLNNWFEENMILKDS